MTRLRKAVALLAGVCALAASLIAGSTAPARADGCQFILGFKTIHDALTTTVGDCLDNQAFAANGDALQHSVKGLLAWRKADNWTAFTDGYHTWVNGPNGIQERLNTERFPFESDQTASGGSATVGSCPDVHNAFANSCSLGNVGQGGVTVKSRIKTLKVPYDRDAWDLVIADHPQALYVTLQDLWYSMGVQVWQKETQTKLVDKIFRAGADEFKRRTIQFVMPEVVVKTLDPATYTIFVYAGPYADDPTAQPIPGENATFDPNRGYTLNVALGDPVCGTTSSGNFQLGMTVGPKNPSQFSLITFNAFIAPPYTDLYDFDWSIDGKQVATGVRQVYQIAASALGGTGSHTVGVNARGVRPYPDSVPYVPFTPPNMSLQCGFTITPSS